MNCQSVSQGRKLKPKLAAVCIWRCLLFTKLLVRDVKARKFSTQEMLPLSSDQFVRLVYRAKSVRSLMKFIVNFLPTYLSSNQFVRWYRASYSWSFFDLYLKYANTPVTNTPHAKAPNAYSSSAEAVTVLATAAVGVLHRLS